MRTILTIVSSTFLFFSSPMLMAETRMVEMQRRIEVLESQVKSMESKIDSLTALLEEALAGSSRLTKTNDNTTTEVVTKRQSTKPEQPVTPLKPQLPKRISESTKTYRSAEDILQDIPSILKPKQGKWSSESLSTLKSWLGSALDGQKLRTKLTISRSQISTNPKHYDDPLAPQWIIKFYTDRTEMKMGELKIRQVITGGGGQPLEILGDNELADKVRIAKGKSFEVTGDIERMQIGPKIGGYREIKLQLNNYKMKSPTLPFRY